MLPEPIRINRAPVLTLWAAIVAERLGHSRETALTLGQAVAGMTAHAKGVRLGIYAAPADHTDKPALPKPKGATGTVHDVALLGRRIAVAPTKDGLRAMAKGAIVKPEAVERYLAGRFGEHLVAVRGHMERLAQSIPGAKLDEQAFRLYERFRPEVPSDEKGWGAKGILDLAKVDALIEP